MFFKQNIKSGRPVQLYYDHDTGVCYLDIDVDGAVYVFEAHGGMAISLLRSVTKDTQAILVEYDPNDLKTILSYSILR